MTLPVVPARFYLDRVLAELPRALTLVDRDPSSPSHGCFDRSYWHYRTQDFPSGMYQELVLPLAQLHALAFVGNPWHGEPRLRELALAGIDFAARSAHADGSCDDYFPYERALGATAFAAAAAGEALWLLGDRDPARLAFLRRRCQWLLGHDESGRLANHHALVALAAARAARLSGDAALLEGARARLSRCLEWQHAEGWFPEYEGADPGYQTLSIAFLAALAELLPTPELDAALERALAFAAHFLHPDGAFGGETGSRNTCQVLPSGFERLAQRSPVAHYLADGWLAGAAAGRAGHPDDDRLFGHWLSDFVTAHLARGRRRAAPAARFAPPPGRCSFPAAGLHVIRDDDWTLVVATAKGGVLRAYRGEKLVASDTGLVARAGPERWVMHQVDPGAEVRFEERAVVVRGSFQRAPRHLPTPLRQVAFRALNASVGRAAPDLLRRLLQRVLITGKRPAPLRFERRIAWDGAALEVSDRLEADADAAHRIDALWASSDATSIYVAASNLWQSGSLQCWEPLPDAAERLRREGRAVVRRSRR